MNYWFRVEHCKRKFTPEEDQKIQSMVSELGTHSWKEIAAALNRTPRQCRERWKHYLSQTIEKSPWTSQEDAILEKMHVEIGPKWSIIAQSLPGRTDVNIKNRWALLCRKQNKAKLKRNKSFNQKICMQQNRQIYIQQPGIYQNYSISFTPSNEIVPQMMQNPNDDFQPEILDDTLGNTSAENSSIFDHFLREVEKLQLKTNPNRELKVLVKLEEDINLFI